MKKSLTSLFSIPKRFIKVIFDLSFLLFVDQDNFSIANPFQNLRKKLRKLRKILVLGTIKNKENERQEIIISNFKKNFHVTSRLLSRRNISNKLLNFIGT